MNKEDKKKGTIYLLLKILSTNYLNRQNKEKCYERRY